MSVGPDDPSAGSLRVAVIALADVDDDVLAAWRELGAEAAEPNPFFSPEMLLPAARRLPGGSDVSLLTVWRGPKLALAMPVTRTRYRRIPWRATTTWRHPYCFVGTPLVRADELETAPAAALEALRRSRRGWLVLEQVYVQEPVVLAFRRAAAAAGASWVEHGRWERPVLQARDEDGRAESALSTRSAKRLRRLRRNLEAYAGPVESTDRADSAEPAVVDAEIEAFLEMELTGWKGRAGTAIAAADGHAAFFREACRAFARDGRLMMWRLRAGGVEAARECHLRAGDTIYAWKTAYAEELARFSPGVQLELDLIQALNDHPARRLDPCTADEPSTSARLYGERRVIGDVLVGLAPAGRVVTRLLPHAARAWTRAKRGRGRGAPDAPGDEGSTGAVPDA